MSNNHAAVFVQGPPVGKVPLEALRMISGSHTVSRTPELTRNHSRLGARARWATADQALVLSMAS